MSTDPEALPRIAVRVLASLVALGTARVSARAADVEFRPSLTLGAFHDGNIAVVGGGRGDDFATLGLNLAVDRKTAQSVFNFSYRPSYAAYRESSDLDFFANTVVMSFARTSSLQSRLTVDADVSRTQYQGQTDYGADRATTLVPRTTETGAHFSVGGTASGGRRSLFDWQARGAIQRFKDLPDNPATPVPNDVLDFNDSTAFGARGGWRRELSERATLGLGLDLAHFSYEHDESAFVESLGLAGTFLTARTVTLNYAAGATRAVTKGESVTGVSFEGAVTHTVSERTNVAGGLRQTFAPGTGLAGPTQDRGGWVSFTHTAPLRGLSGSLLGGYWRRDGLQFGTTQTQADTTTSGANGTIGWSFNRYVALNASASYVYQRGRNGADPSLDTDYGSYGVYLRWAIRGR